MNIPHLRRWRAAGLLMLSALALLVAGLLATQPSRAQPSTRTFNHTNTGFPLLGAHLPLQCVDCHMNGVFKGTPRDCASCHSPGARLAMNNVVKPQQHFATTLSCDSCHSTVSFSGAKFNHLGVTAATCANCHNTLNATGKPPGHIPTTAACSTCHRTSGWLPATSMDHSQFTSATVCSTCHNGASATGKPVTHIPTALNCTSCHSTTAWKPTQWNHTQSAVTNQCSTCHSGAYPPADGKTSNHIPYQQVASSASANCDSCHKGGYASWYPGKFHNNVTVTTQCATCHLSSQYGLTSRPNTSTHSGIQSNCENCHKSTVTWGASNKPDHSLFTTATVCGNCHNGSTASGKVSNHIPTTLNCISCHSTTAWYPGKYHSKVSTPANCSSCHGSALYGLTTKPSNHIPVTQLLNGSTLECNACHTSTTSWSSERMNHNNSMGSGAGMCTACHASGNSYLGSMQKKSLNHRGGSSVKTDCSQSGCHRPLGNTGSTYKSWT